MICKNLQTHCKQQSLSATVHKNLSSENRNNKISKERFRTYYKTIIGVNDNGDIIEVDYLSDLREYGFTARDIETISKAIQFIQSFENEYAEDFEINKDEFKVYRISCRCCALVST